MKPEVNENKIVVFTGAGVSAESGIPTFRDAKGLWNKYSVEEVASLSAWKNNPELVLDFYNERRRVAHNAIPNKAHLAIAALEEKYEVVVVTQNVDDLHEQAGSSNVIHVHGQFSKARSTEDENLFYDYSGKDIMIGDFCEKGSQLRPHVVWFGEAIQNYDVSRDHLRSAGRVLVVGSSLTVFPAAGLLKKARGRAEKVVISVDLDKKPYGFQCLRGEAGVLVPTVVEHWLNGRKAI